MFDNVKQLILRSLLFFGNWLLRRTDLSRYIDERAKDVVRREFMLAHGMARGYPLVKYTFIPEITPDEQDFAIARRLLEAYRKSMREATGDGRADLWTNLAQSMHKEFIELLAQNDPEALAGYLCNMHSHDVTHGLSQGTAVCEELKSGEERRRFIATFFLDKVICLAEALGCFPCETAEQEGWGNSLYADVEGLLDEIEKTIGVDITQPGIGGGLFGLDTTRGVLHLRCLNALYTAWRIRQILRHRQNPSVCEIGAGIGYVAAASHKLGIKNYSIFDLPYVAVLSGYQLIKSLPQANVVLYGEEESSGEGSIKIYPYWHFESIDKKCFDLTLNQDSFPEVDVRVVNKYLDSMQRNTREFFLSINQEARAWIITLSRAQLFVSSLMRNRADFELVYRFRYWMREGYTEELYRIR
ncbi:MAG: putative sugar O-methyltransferase [Syntrophorhabdales bacterium]